MHTEHALQLARQRQADLRRGTRTPRLERRRRSFVGGVVVRAAAQPRQTLGWLLVDVGLKLAVNRPEPAEERAAA
ncbi:MAG: hypothetical protein ABSE47_06590 [Acidimicrobiales bacterium]|jgi:hypothetical protein